MIAVVQEGPPLTGSLVTRHWREVETLVVGPLHSILVINGGQSRPHLGSSLQGCGWRSIEPLYTAKVFVRLQANLPMRYLLTRG
jgi:hypothetical protein